MKKNLLSLIFIAATLSAQAQNVASTANVTSGGLQAGNAGVYNTFYGTYSGKATTGSNNTFIGYQTARYNSSGSENTIIGSNSGGSITTGINNTFLGSNAGGSNPGSNNTFLGKGSGFENWGSNNIFIGTDTGFDTGNGSNNILIGNNCSATIEENNTLWIENSWSDKPLIWGDFANDKLKFNGKVGIGYAFGTFPTTAGGVNVSVYNLFVNGGILTEEVRVILKAQWADYVFADNYNLKSLKEVEQFIKQNGHLPNVPSAAQVKENGIEVGEIITIQQEKIEELTLHLINQEKQLEELKAQVKQLLKAQN
ncbi:hypothetical protein [Paenimyroides baculatum]|uniref:BZIP transcription factor n=1 Tax=Paenimyroides baculatum TaxID=2608000 RepID=A0A5M6CTC4_9FLAO|nr:hypothetical protein [Paenimyroides baculatum]KAA5538196.1 hypothetical protein F0460_00915 [Paenimyroides baculatum]